MSPRVSKLKAVAWILLTLSVSVDVTADAFTSLATPMVAVPRRNNFDDNNRRRISNVIISRRSTNPTDGNADKEEEEDNHQQLEESIAVRGGGTDVKKPPPSLPTWKQFQAFALPCLGLWIAQPLLSLVDTAFVGLSGAAETSAQQLAALGPATTFIDGSTYLFAFLNVATTNLYSSARAQRGEQSEKAESVVRTASRVALKCGVGLMIFLLAFARPLLALYIGKIVPSSFSSKTYLTLIYRPSQKLMSFFCMRFFFRS